MKKEKIKPVYEKQPLSKRVAAMLPAVLLLALAIWLWTLTFGTKLLHTSSGLGELSKHYVTLLVLALVAAFIGAVATRPRKVEPKPESTETPAVEAPVVAEIEAPKPEAPAEPEKAPDEATPEKSEEKPE